MRLRSMFLAFMLTMVMVMAVMPAPAGAEECPPRQFFVNTQVMSDPHNWWPVTLVMVGDTVYDWAAVTTAGSIQVLEGQVWFDVKVPGSDVWTPYGTPKNVISEWTASDPYTVAGPGTYYFRAHYGNASSGECEETLHVACLQVCETAWAAESIGTHRFAEKGNWGTYVHYTKGLEASYPLFAGQTHYAGDLVVRMVGSSLYLEFRSASDYTGGAISQWSMIEYHVAVGNTPQDMPHTKTGNPIPGQFLYQWTGGRLGTVEVGPIPVGGLNDTFVISAHAVMMWAGYIP